MEVAEKTNKFLWLGNSPALDFVNTEIVVDGKTIDLLTGELDLAGWLVQSGLVERIPAHAEAGEKALRAARGFRDSLRAGLPELIRSGRLPGGPTKAVNQLLQRHTVGFNLQPHRQQSDLQGFTLKTDWALHEPKDWCAPVALSFAQLLSSADIRRIRRCKNPACVLYFYDTSKSGTRSWCSLDICGNKLRMAALRQRQSEG